MRAVAKAVDFYSHGGTVEETARNEARSCSALLR